MRQAHVGACITDSQLVTPVARLRPWHPPLCITRSGAQMSTSAVLCTPARELDELAVVHWGASTLLPSFGSSDAARTGRHQHAGSAVQQSDTRQQQAVLIAGTVNGADINLIGNGHHQLHLQPLQHQSAAQEPLQSIQQRSSSHQQQQQVRLQRQWSSRRDWQWLAAQLHCSSSSSSSSGGGGMDRQQSLKATIDMLTQLSQPGVAPSHSELHQQQPYFAFLAQLLSMAAQQLRACSTHVLSATADSTCASFSSACTAADVTDLLWGLAKLQLSSQWQSQEQKQQQQQHQKAGPAMSLLITQRAAEITAVAASLLQQQLLQVADQQPVLLQLQQHNVSGMSSSSSNSGSKLSSSPYSPRQLALCGWALGRLQYPASQRFWAVYLPAVQQQLLHCNVQDLAQVIWALSSWKHHPGQQWMQDFLAAAQQAICSSRRSSSHSRGQAAGMIMLSLAELQEVPPADWVQAVLQGPQRLPIQQQQTSFSLLQELNGQALASLLGALAKWGYVVNQQFMVAVQGVIQQQLARCNGQDTAQINWALATLTAAAFGSHTAGSDGVSSLHADCMSGAVALGAENAGWDSSISCNGRASLAVDDDAGINEQETGVALLRKQLQLDDLHSHISQLHPVLAHSHGCSHHLLQQQQQLQQQLQSTQGVIMHVDASLLQQLAQRLAETASKTPACQVALGLWAMAKLWHMHGKAHQASAQLQQPSQAYLGRCQQHDTVSAQQLEQQQLQQWQDSRSALLFCATVLLQQQQHRDALDCKHLAYVAWSLIVAAGKCSPSGKVMQQQKPKHSLQQEQRQRHRHHAEQVGRSMAFSNGGSSSIDANQNPQPGSGGSSSSRIKVAMYTSSPSQLMQQVIVAAKPQLAAAEPQSQALLLSAAAQLGVQPSWQWMLTFYEASAAQLSSCCAQDLSAMAAALEKLQLRPLTAWRDRFLEACKILAGRQNDNFRAECLTHILSAVASEHWGLTQQWAANAADTCRQQRQWHQQRQQQEQHQLSLVDGVCPGWSQAMQQQVLQRLSQVTLQQLLMVSRSAIALQWHRMVVSQDSTVMTQVLAEIAKRCCGQGAVQHNSDSRDTWQVLQVMSVAVQLPAAVFPEQWWRDMAGQLQHSLLQQQQQWWRQQHPQHQQQEQPGMANVTSHRHLLLCLRTLTAAIESQQHCQQEDGVVPLARCLEVATTLVTRVAADLPVHLLHQLLSATHSCKALLQTMHSSCVSSTASNSRACGGALMAAASAMQQLERTLQQRLKQQLPSSGLQDVSAVLAVVSRSDMAHVDGAGSGLRTRSGALWRAAVTALDCHVSALQKLLPAQQASEHAEQAQLIYSQQQSPQHVPNQQVAWQAQLSDMAASPRGSRIGNGRSGETQLWQRTANHSSKHQPAAAVAASELQVVAPHLVQALAAFARCCYRPSKRLLQNMLLLLEPCLPGLTVQQIAALALAAARLQLGSCITPGFRARYWVAVSRALQHEPVRHNAVSMQLSVQQLGNARRSSSAPSSSSSTISHAARVLLLVRSLKALLCSRAGEHSNSSSGSTGDAGGVAAAAAVYATRSSAVGAAVPRQLAEQAFWAASNVWAQLNSTPQQQVQLLWLLAPSAARLSAAGMKQFCRTVGAQLCRLPQSYRAPAWAAMQQLLQCWRTGRQQRQWLAPVQQQKQKKKQQLSAQGSNRQWQEQQQQQKEAYRLSEHHAMVHHRQQQQQHSRPLALQQPGQVLCEVS